MITRRSFSTAGAALVAASVLDSRHAMAQASGRTARIVVGFAPGGSTDAVGRMLADKLRGGTLGTNVIVENKAGAGGRIGAEYVKNAEPDGNTLIVTPDAIMYLYPHVYRNLPYNVMRDFTPVVRASKTVLSVFAGAGLPESVRTVAEFITYAKAHPKSAVYATAGAGATVHFTGVMIEKASGVALGATHYRGAAPAIQDLIGGQIPVFIGGLGDGLPMVKAGRIRSLGTTGPVRSPFLPEAPTLVEQGFKDIVVVEGFGIYAPIKTPAVVVAKINQEVRELLKARDVIDRLATFGFEPGGETPEEFAKTIAFEYERWAPVVLASGFKAEE
jgi:tripartite-type tricarboxylate transporter receptor subunit TctC